MDAVTIIPVVLVVALTAVAVVAVLMMRRRPSAQLRQTFGSKYERTVEGANDRTRAEKHLRHRGKRRATFELQPLSHDSAIRYREQWNGIQQRFVDEPAYAVEQADRLVVEVMRERGYPVDDFDQRAGDASADHPEIAHHYRDAHGVAVAHTRGQADTGQLRRAVTSYRVLVDTLLYEDSHNGGGRPRRDMQKER